MENREGRVRGRVRMGKKGKRWEGISHEGERKVRRMVQGQLLSVTGSTAVLHTFEFDESTRIMLAIVWECHLMKCGSEA